MNMKYVKGVKVLVILKELKPYRKNLRQVHTF